MGANRSGVRVEWRSHTWAKCVHGCGFFATEVAVIELVLPGEQLVAVLCFDCLARMQEDPVFKGEVVACL